MHYRLNFTTTTADRLKLRKFRRYTWLVYCLIFATTATLLFRTGYGYHQMYSNLKSYQSSLRSELAEIQPRVTYLERLIDKRNQLNEQFDFYNQVDRKPAVLAARIGKITKTLPNQVILDQIRFDVDSDPRGQIEPGFTVDGHLNILSDRQNIQVVDTYRSVLTDDLLWYGFDAISLRNNHIYKDLENLKLIFSLGLN